VFASDNLSSTAYATEEILLVLTAAGTAYISYALPAASLILVLELILVVSYSQTLAAYPSGGGAYIVSKDNLGIYSALIAGAALLIDYVLTVAVSVAAGIAAVTSALPSLYSHRVALCLVAIFIIMWGNLRGVRESAAIFGVPVYLFILFAYLLTIGAFVRYGSSGGPPAEEAASQAAGDIPLFLFLTAFASGCTALTGMEAIANGVQAFRPPSSRNAVHTQVVMAAILGSLFLGITIVAGYYHLVPREGETILSQLGRLTFGTGIIYYLIQASTMAILILAANTSFADFPRLSSFIARDRFLPRQFANLGDRLVFSNGIIFLGVTAGILVAVFGGDVHALIPLYMVGVFIAFTLSQAGMVLHWKRLRGKGYRWRMALNAVGAATTALVLVVVAAVKFTHGAWLVLVAIPAFVWVFLKIRQHYFLVATELSLASFDRMQELKHTVVVPVPGVNRASLGAIEYARSLSPDVIAVQVNTEGEDRRKLTAQWEDWVEDVPLVILNSPYRSILRPLLQFIEEMEQFHKDDVVTVLLPEFVPAHWWQRLLHNQNGLILRSALSFKPNVVVTSVRRHLRK
jgi:amino acid transporter